MSDSGVAASEIDHILFLKVTGPTQEKNFRIQTCAKSEKSSRLFITTVYAKQFPKHREFVSTMTELVAKGN